MPLQSFVIEGGMFFQLQGFLTIPRMLYLDFLEV